MPSLPLALVYHYLVMVIIHRLFWRDPLLTVGSVVKAVVLGVGIGALLWLSGNNTIMQLVWGMVVGVVVGGLFSAALYCFALERMWVFSMHWFFGTWLQYRSHDLELEALYQGWAVKTAERQQLLSETGQEPRPRKKPKQKRGEVHFGVLAKGDKDLLKIML